MKWYSVKKYKPALSLSNVIVWADGEIYIAYPSFGESITYYDTNSDEETAIENVTHFFIPDPIEIEND